MDSLDYEKWIKRERKIRVKILQSSPAIREEHIFRSCAGCGEICLCHEEACPNCNSGEIISGKLDYGLDDDYIKERIRCRFRFDHLSDGPVKERK